MPKKSTALALLLAATWFATLTNPARAELFIYVYQSGSNVITSASGSADTTDLSKEGNTTSQAYINSSSGSGAILLGSTSNSTPFEYYSGVSGPSNFHGGSYTGYTTASSGSGDEVGIAANPYALFLPTTYVSGASLMATDTYSNTTISGLGLATGVYTYSWGTLADADSLVLNIGSAPSVVPEPASIAMMTLASLGLGIAHLARKRRSKTA